MDGIKLSAFHTFHSMMRLDGEAFIRELYRQLLGREPDAGGFHSHLIRLNTGTPKLVLVEQILSSEEAGRLYSLASTGAGPAFLAAPASIYERLCLTSPQEFVYALYRELLCREPDMAGVSNHLSALANGLPRNRLIGVIILSPEFQELLTCSDAEHRPIRQAGASVKHIGMFLGFRQMVQLDGEGIGRFVVRLVEGLLLNDSDVVVHVVTTEQNYAELQSLLAEYAAFFPHRLFLLSFPNVGWLNQNMDVDLWCVPYVGMELALELEKPFILCVHDLVYLHFRELYVRKHRELVAEMERVVYAMANKAAKVVFNSHYIQRNEGLRFLGLLPSKTRVIRLAAPAEEYRTFGIVDETAFRNKYRLFGGYIVYPSVIRAHKNHDRLIEAFIRFRQTPEGLASNLKLVLTDHYKGRPLEEEICSILSQCRDASIRSSIVYAGRLPSRDMPSLYKYAMGTVVPTLFEGSCPFPILESLVVGTPVAISRIAVTEEVIGNMGAFLPFNPYSVSEIQEAIGKLWRNHPHLADRQKAALGSALKRTWSDVAREYAELFDSVSLGTST